MFYTFTPNPAVDMNFNVKSMRAGTVNRTSDLCYTPNGKALNVSFVLKHFGVASMTFGFYGGFTGKYIVDQANARGVPVFPVWVDEPTRINIFVNNKGKEYKMVGEGSYVDRKAQLEMLKMIESKRDMEYLCISGSLPKGISPTFYDEILLVCEKNKVKVILDSSNSKINCLLKYRPFLIKPNDEELKLFGLSAKTEKLAAESLRELYRRGARNILLTMGDKGAYFYNGEKIYYSNTVPVRLVSSACAGDAALAAFLSVWIRNDYGHIKQAMKISAAVGANVAESSGIGDLANVEKYEAGITVREVKNV